MLKSSVQTVEFVAEHARYRHSGGRRFQIEEAGVRATSGPTESWWGTADVVPNRLPEDDEGPTGLTETEEEDEVEFVLSSPDVKKEEPNSEDEDDDPIGVRDLPPGASLTR